MSGVFLSFVESDDARAREIAARLQAGGVEVTLSAHDRATHLLNARCVVSLFSPRSEGDEAFRRETVAALNNAKPLLPVMLGDVEADGWARPFAEMQQRVDARGTLTPAAASRVVEGARGLIRGGRTIAMLNIKGGVGKTVLAANVFAAAHLELGKRICLVDLDPQHNLSQFFLPPEERAKLRAEFATVYSVLSARGPLSAPRHTFSRLAVPLNRTKGPETGLFDLVCGDERLFEYTLEARSERDRADALSRFHDLMTGLRSQYDAVVIDVNPCATFLTRCALTAADHIVAPVRPERYSLTGLNMLEQVAREIRGRTIKPLEFSVVLNGVGDRPRTRLGMDVDQSTRDEIANAPFFGTALLDPVVPYTTSLRTTPVDRYAPNPINLTAMRLLTQRSLKEALVNMASLILKRAGAPT